MQEQLRDGRRRSKGFVAAMECLDIKALLQISDCIPGVSGKHKPGQQICAPEDLPPLPAVSPYKPSLHWPASQIHVGASEARRRIWFDPALTPTSSSTTQRNSSDQDSGAANCTAADANGIDGQLRVIEQQACTCEQGLMVRRIPEKCLLELIDTGALERVRLAYTRDVGRMAIAAYVPFRSLYFYAVVIHHLKKSTFIGFQEMSHICDAAVVLHNAMPPIDPLAEVPKEAPSLLQCLALGIGPLDNTYPRQLVRVMMEGAMDIGKRVAQEFQSQSPDLIEEYKRQRCVIRPVHEFMYNEHFEGANNGAGSLPVIRSDLQFEVYRCTREYIAKIYDDQPTTQLYNTFVALFAIVFINEVLADDIHVSQSSSDPVVRLRTTINGDIIQCEHDHRNDGTFAAHSRTLTSREMLCLIDWNLASVIGYLLATRYGESHKEDTAERARLGAFSASVNIAKPLPFPPKQPVLDANFHMFIRGYVLHVYAVGPWPDGFLYMVIEEAVEHYNEIIQRIRDELPRNAETLRARSGYGERCNSR
ncbi:hypothetical protein GQ54DRAFT_32633 [Martensiomyces pterosporus]|nr:hypothetical protein GQ54DRAFT_32633 [Martensiomyces pterosporus]